MSRVFPLHGFALRAATADMTGDRIMRVIRASAAAGLAVERVLVGGVTRAFEPTTAAIDALLTEPAAQFGGLVFPLGDAAMPWVVHVQRDRVAAPRIYDTIRFMLPRAQPDLSDADQVVDYFAGLAAAFDATVGGLYHPELRRVVQARVRARDTGGIVLPPSARIPRPTTPPPGTDAATLARLATPVPPSSYDRSAVPDAVWWANYWSTKVVAQLGASRVEAAAWHRVVPLDGATVYVATEVSPRLGDTAGLQRLAELTESLDLHGAQLSCLA